MANRKNQPKLQELFDKNIPVYSYSKLCTWHECKYNYYQNYILHKKANDNIYTKIGTVVHDDIENIYHNKTTLVQAKENFNKCVRENEKLGISFPENPPTTKINYIKNMNHFYDNYIVKNINMKTEQFVLYKIPRVKNAINDEDYIWIQMYVDSIIPVYKDNKFISVIVNDWKTSSKFSKKDRLENGRQLLMYKLGIEQMTKVPVSKVGWTMLKYVYSCYKTKTNKIKRSMQQRKDAVKFLGNKIVKDLVDMGIDNMEAELLVSKMINDNDLKTLPKELKDKYWIEDCFLEYEFSDELLEECKQWIINTVNEIESTENNINNYTPKQINDKNNYFCFNLCGRPNCIHLIKYKHENLDRIKKDKKEQEINKKTQSKIMMDIDKLFM